MWLKPSIATISSDLNNQATKIATKSLVKDSSASHRNLLQRPVSNAVEKSPTKVNGYRDSTTTKRSNMPDEEVISPMRQRHIASGYTVVPDLDPSTYSRTFLQLCVRAYTRKFHPIFPFLHISTIHSNKALHQQLQQWAPCLSMLPTFELKADSFSSLSTTQSGNRSSRRMTSLRRSHLRSSRRPFSCSVLSSSLALA